MLCKVIIPSHMGNGRESAGPPAGNRAKQSQYVETQVYCNGLSVQRLRRYERDCLRAKTKPIFGVEIASSAGGLLATTPAISLLARFCRALSGNYSFSRLPFRASPVRISADNSSRSACSSVG